jgi:hypothetical protein
MSHIVFGAIQVRPGPHGRSSAAGQAPCDEHQTTHLATCMHRLHGFAPVFTYSNPLVSRWPWFS